MVVPAMEGGREDVDVVAIIALSGGGLSDLDAAWRPMTRETRWWCW